MQNRPPPLAKSHLFAPGANKKGKGRQAPTSMTDASRAHPAPAAGRPQPPPPPPPLASITASGSGSGPPLAPSPQSHRPPSNHHAGPPPPPPPPAGQARPLASLVTPEIRTQVTSAMKLLASITRDQQDRDCLEKAYEWPDLADEERNTLNHKLDLARQAEMAQRDKVIETTYSRLSHDMVVLFSGLVEHATSSRLEGLVRRCDAQQKRIDDLEEAQRGASTTATSSTTAAAADDTSAAAATVAAAQQKRIEDLERKLNTLVQAHAQAQQTTTSSSSPRPAAPPGCPQAYSPTAGGAGASASPPGTPFDPTSSAPADLHATYKELRDKYRYVGNEVRAQKTRIEKLTENVAELQKKLLAPAGQQQQVEEGTGGGGEVFKGLEKRLEKVEQALVATQQQQPPPNGAGNGGATSTGAGGGTVDPRRRPSSTTPADAQAPITAAAAAAAAAEVATLRTDFDAFAARVSSQLGKRSHDGVDSGADHPHKAAKSTEGATPASATAKAGNDDEQQQQVTERLQKVEERLEGCEKKVTALRSDVDKEVSRIDATAVNVADLEKKEKERTEREQAAAAAPPVSKGGSSTSDMDLDKSDEDDQRANANAEKFDVLERRIRQMEASGSPELLIEPVKNEVAELRKLFDERVPLPNTREDPKIILAFIRNLEQSVARSSASAAPVLEALRSFVGTAADGSTLPADQVRSKLLDTLVRMRDDLQRHGTTLASHDRSIKSLVEAGEQTDSKFEALQDLGNLLGEALPQLRDLYLLVCRAQEMNLFPKTATLFPNANANANANTLAITNGSHGSPTPGASSTTTGAAANAAPNGMGSTASSSSGANPAPQPNGIVGARPPPTTTAATTSSTATTGAHAPAQGRPSATPAAPPSTSTSTSTSTNPSSLPQRPQQPQGQGQQRPGSANGSSSGATPRGRF